MQTEQERFWSGKFGDEYTERSLSWDHTRRRLGFLIRLLKHVSRLGSVIEFGANIGHNLRALQLLVPAAKLSAIEINDKAFAELNKLNLEEVYHQSILDFQPDFPREMALTSGVLIHLNPDYLPQVYEKLYQSSFRYICLYEYYNPTPVEVHYRGHSGKLFKRDFAGEMMDGYPDLELVGYGFIYHRDPFFPTDDSTWFLLEKKPPEH
jgi:pseudaminic acid biosynthesis-associated methylase